jgi:hypothetical protein
MAFVVGLNFAYASDAGRQMTGKAFPKNYEPGTATRAVWELCSWFTKGVATANERHEDFPPLKKGG